MQELRLRARAKINLTLDVTGKRDDGYHTLEMIMQTVSLYDSIYMKKIRKQGIRLKTNLPWLPSDEKNLAYRGAKLLMDEFSITEGVFIELTKRIPVAAGLAGGSSDCAAVLWGMNRLFSLGLSQKELMDLGLRLGTDIPYCILRGTALATGVGEKLQSLPHCPHFYVVLVKPPVSVSTAFVYQNLSLPNINHHPDTEAMISALSDGDHMKIGTLLDNVLETVTIPLHPQIQGIKKKFLELGALGALMSGSGPTVFGLFQEKDKAMAAAAKMRHFFGYRDVFVTETFQGERGHNHAR